MCPRAGKWNVVQLGWTQRMQTSRPVMNRYGTLYSQAAGRGLAHLRYDLAQDRMQAGSAEIRAGQMPA